MYSDKTRDDFKQYIVKEAKGLLDFLLENVEGESRTRIKSTLSGRGVKVDGKIITQFDYPLTPGMRVYRQA